MRSVLGVAAALAFSLVGGVPASAHHSAAAFDRSHTVVATGVLKRFQWANPHCWIYLVVPDGKGGGDEWALEGASVSILARNNWTSQSITPGETLRILVAPNKDGSHGGEFLTVTKADGTVLKFGII